MQAGEIDGWLALCSDDIAVEFPFAPRAAQRIDGKEALSAHLKGRVARRLSAPEVEHLTVHQSADPTTVIAEMTIRGEEGATRAAIAVVTVHDGLMTLYRDYWNPLDLRADNDAPDR
jgi:ketosteroid isomerase-like protein